MNALANIIFLTWIPVAVAIFSRMKVEKGLIFAAVVGVLFLPMASMPMPLVPYAKNTAIGLGLLAGALLTDPGKVTSFRFSWVDMPMALCVLGPFPTGVVNGIPPYDSLAAAVGNGLVFGIPWFLGRVFLGDMYRMRQLAMAFFYGGISYILPCLFEMKVGPEFHHILYGFYPHPDYLQAIREGGFRPMICMQHGLMVGFFMSAATLCGIALWAAKAMPKTILRMPSWLLICILGGVTVLCKSTGALILLISGVVVIFLTKKIRTYALVYVLVAAPLAYIFARTIGGWDGENLAIMVQEYLSKDRADSLRTRFGSETLLVAKAMEKPVFGWGPEGRQQVTDPLDPTHLLAIPDGMWEGTLGAWGWVGLVAAYAVLLVPLILLIRKIPNKAWGTGPMAAPAAFAVIGALYGLDNLMNNMVNPLYYLALGGVASFALSKQPLPPRAGPARLKQRPLTQAPPMLPSAAIHQPLAPLPDDFCAPNDSPVQVV